MTGENAERGEKDKSFIQFSFSFFHKCPMLRTKIIIYHQLSADFRMLAFLASQPGDQLRLLYFSHSNTRLVRTLLNVVRWPILEAARGASL